MFHILKFYQIKKSFIKKKKIFEHYFEKCHNQYMKKSKLFSIFLIILIALFATGCTKKISDLKESGKESGGKLENVKGSLMDVIKMGKSVKCTGSYSGDDGTMEMVVYSAGKKSYSEMEMSAGEDGKLTSYSIVDGEWMYTWTDVTWRPNSSRC